MKRRETHHHGRLNVSRREFIKTGFSALSTLAVGETIWLTPTDAEAQLFSSKKNPSSASAKPNAAPTARGASRTITPRPKSSRACV
jgi:hypothetical protein